MLAFLYWCIATNLKVWLLVVLLDGVVSRLHHYSVMVLNRVPKVKYFGYGIDLDYLYVGMIPVINLIVVTQYMFDLIRLSFYVFAIKSYNYIKELEQ